MKHRMISFLVLLVLAGCWAPARGQDPTLTETSDGFRATLTRTFDVEPGGTLTIERVVGSIAVSTWDQNRVEVTETIRLAEDSRSDAQEYVRRHRSTVEQSGNTVSVRGPDRSPWSGWGRGGNAQHAFEVRLPRAFNADVSTAGGSVNVEGLQGRVNANTSGGSIRVGGVVGTVRVNTSGGSLSLTDIEGPVEGNTSGGSINAERVTGRLDVRTSGGSIRIHDVQADVDAATAGGSVSVEEVRGAVHARTSGGDMTLRAIDGDARAQTSGGDIDLAGIGGRAEVRTSGGDIEGRALGGPVRAETSAGDIELEDVRAGVDARTSVGDIRVELTVEDFDADYATRLATSLPPDRPATVQAEVRPLYRWDQDDILSDFPLSRTTPDDDRSSTLRSAGDINGGGPTIDLRTSGGSIRIRSGSR